MSRGVGEGGGQICGIEPADTSCRESASLISMAWRMSCGMGTQTSDLIDCAMGLYQGAQGELHTVLGCWRCRAQIEARTHQISAISNAPAGENTMLVSGLMGRFSTATHDAPHAEISSIARPQTLLYERTSLCPLISSSLYFRRLLPKASNHARISPTTQ